MYKNGRWQVLLFLVALGIIWRPIDAYAGLIIGDYDLCECGRYFGEEFSHVDTVFDPDEDEHQVNMWYRYRCLECKKIMPLIIASPNEEWREPHHYVNGLCECGLPENYSGNYVDYWCPTCKDSTIVKFVNEGESHHAYCAACGGDRGVYPHSYENPFFYEYGVCYCSASSALKQVVPEEFEYWILGNTGTIAIDDYNGSSTHLVIPEKIDGYTVSRINAYAFYNDTDLESVEIPDTVTTIQDYAFHDCSSLMEISIPDSVTDIGAGAFEGCSSLRKVQLPSGIKNIKKYTFAYCKSLTEIVIPEGVTSIGRFALYWCDSLEKITIPQSVCEIDGALPWRTETVYCVFAGSYAESYAIKNENEYVIIDKMPPTKNNGTPTLTVDKGLQTGLVAYPGGGTGATINVSSNTKWRAYTTDDWVSISNNESTGNGNFTVYVAANDTGISRQAYIVVHATDCEPINIEVRQEPIEMKETTMAGLWNVTEMTTDGIQIDMEIYSSFGMDLYLKLLEDGQAMLKLDMMDENLIGKAIKWRPIDGGVELYGDTTILLQSCEDGRLLLKQDENNYIYFTKEKAEKDEEAFSHGLDNRLDEKDAPMLSIDAGYDNGLEADVNGGRGMDIHVSCSTAWQLEVTQGQEWIKLSTTGGSGDGEFYTMIAPNTGSARQGQIVLTAPGCESITIPVIQPGSTEDVALTDTAGNHVGALSDPTLAPDNSKSNQVYNPPAVNGNSEVYENAETTYTVHADGAVRYIEYLNGQKTAEYEASNNQTRIPLTFTYAGRFMLQFSAVYSDGMESEKSDRMVITVKPQVTVLPEKPSVQGIVDTTSGVETYYMVHADGAVRYIEYINGKKTAEHDAEDNQTSIPLTFANAGRFMLQFSAVYPDGNESEKSDKLVVTVKKAAKPDKPVVQLNSDTVYAGENVSFTAQAAPGASLRMYQNNRPVSDFAYTISGDGKLQFEYKFTSQARIMLQFSTVVDGVESELSDRIAVNMLAASRDGSDEEYSETKHMSFTMDKTSVEAYTESVKFTFRMKNANAVIFYADGNEIMVVDDELFAIAPSVYEWTYTFNSPGKQREIQFKPVYREIGKEDLVGSITPIQYLDVTAYLTVSGSASFPAYKGGGDGTPINVSSNMPWTATSDVPWITLNADAANGILYHIYEQNTEPDERVGKVTISADGCADVVLTATQNAYDKAEIIGKPVLAPANGSNGQNGDEFTLTVTTNAATTRLSAVNNNETPYPMKVNAFKCYPQQNGQKKWIATYTAEMPHPNRFWTVTPYNEVEVAGASISSDPIIIKPSPTPIVPTTPSPSTGLYNVYYMYDSDGKIFTAGADTLGGADFFINVPAGVKNIQVYVGASKDNLKHPSDFNGNNEFSYEVVGDQKVLSVTAHGYDIGVLKTGSTKLNILKNGKVVASVVVRVMGNTALVQGGNIGYSLISEDLIQNDEYALDGADGYIYYFQGVGRLRLKIKDNTNSKEYYPSQTNGWYIYVNGKRTIPDSEWAVNLEAGSTYTIRLEYGLFDGDVISTLKVTVYETDPALEGALQELKNTVVTNISSESEETETTRDLINTNADLMKYRIDEMPTVTVNGFPLASGNMTAVFNPKGITSVAYLNREDGVGLSAIMLVDINGNSVIYSFHPAEGEFILHNSGESHMRYMSASETYDFLYSISNAGQLSSLAIRGNSTGNMVTNNNDYFTENSYHRAVVKSVDSKNGELMYDVCIQLFADKNEKYSSLSNNGDNVAIRIFTLNTDTKQQQREFANIEGWNHNYLPVDTLNALVDAGYEFIEFGGYDELTNTYVNAADLGYQTGDELYGTSTALTKGAKANWSSMSLNQKKLWYELQVGKYDRLPFDAMTSENKELDSTGKWLGRQVDKTARSTVIFFSDPAGETYSLLLNSLKNAGNVTEYIWTTAANEDHVSNNDRRAFAEVLINYWAEEIAAGNISTENIREYVELLHKYQAMKTEQKKIDTVREIIKLIPGATALSREAVDYVVSGSGDILDDFINQYAALLVIEAIEQKAISIEGYPTGVQETIKQVLNTKRDITMKQIENLINTTGEMASDVIMSGAEITFTVGSIGTYNVIEAACTALSLEGDYESHNEALSLVEGAYRDYAKTVESLQSALNSYANNPTGKNYQTVVAAVTPYRNAANAMVKAFFEAKAYDGNDYSTTTKSYRTKVDQICEDMLGK